MQLCTTNKLQIHFCRHTAEATKGKEGVQKRSPLDLLMNQLRRKASFTERKKPAVGRLFRPSESSDKRNSNIPEMKESEASEGKENNDPGKGRLDI